MSQRFSRACKKERRAYQKDSARNRPARATQWLIFLLMGIVLSAASSNAPAAPVRNVIFMIGDGMGLQQIKAANQYLGAPLAFETLPYQGYVTTYSADNSVTDSAAAGSAMATGHKVNNGVISQARPSNSAYPSTGSDMLSMLEHFKALDRSTGLVTTTYVTHATPAAFGAHTSSRDNHSEIASDYLNGSRPNVLFGGGANGMSVSAAEAAGYSVVTTLDQMLALDTDAATMVSGQFGTGYLPYEYDGSFGALPHLSDMTASALDILDNDPDGFFLMVEGGTIDQSCHDNNIRRAIQETVEFNNTVQLALDWAAGRKDTLIIVTADHETGGLSVLNNPGVGLYPSVSWSTGNHTSSNVGVFAWGPNAELISGVMNNTDFFEIATTVVHTRLAWDELGPGNWADARWTGDTPPNVPDETVDVEVKTDLVSLDANALALTLAVTSGELLIESTGTLTVIEDATIAADGSLNLEGSLSAKSFVAAGGSLNLEGNLYAKSFTAGAGTAGAQISVAPGAQLTVTDTLTVDSVLDLTGASLTTDPNLTNVVVNQSGSLSLDQSLHAASLSVTRPYHTTPGIGSVEMAGAELGSLDIGVGGQVTSSADVVVANASVDRGTLRLTNCANLQASSMEITSDSGTLVDTDTGWIEIDDTLKIGENLTLGIDGGSFGLRGSNLAHLTQQSEILLSGGQLTIGGGATAPTGAIATWKLDEGTGSMVADTSLAGNDHVGTIVGANWIDDPQHGTVLRFNATDDSLQIANAADIQAGSPHTIAMWINTSAMGGKLVGMDDGNGMWFLGEKSLCIDRYTGVVTLLGASAGALTGTTNVADGDWHHIVVTYNGSTALGGQEVYVDGQLDTAMRSYWASNDSYLFYLGDSDYNRGQSFAGLMDDVYVFDRSLSATEVADLHDSFGTTGLDLSNASLRVIADSTMFLDTQQAEVALADLTIDAGVALTISGAAARFDNLTGGHLASIAGNLIVAGDLSVGNSPGTLNVLGDLTLDHTSAYLWEIGDEATDLVAVDGNLTLAEGWTLRLADAGGLCDAADQFDLFTCTGTLSLGQGLLDTSAVEGLANWDCSGATIAQDGSRVYLTGLTVVPEPGTIVLVVSGILGLLGFGLRRRFGS